MTTSSSVSIATTSMRPQVSKYASALKAFGSSSSTFKVLHSIPQTSDTHPLPRPQSLYILDSSFNPPTVAHRTIALGALLHDTGSVPTPKRLLLLLATQNADKAPQPASFPQRLVMMEIFANDLLNSLPSSSTSSLDLKQSQQISVDIGVTTQPYFMDKASSISASPSYPPSIEQTHLVGFDTLIRMLDPKYYPPTYNLSVLESFFKDHRLRVAYRADDKWGERAEQERYLKEIEDGKRKAEGAREEWVTYGRIELVEGSGEGDVISSTRVREVLKTKAGKGLEGLLTEGVAEWVLNENLYVE